MNYTPSGLTLPHPRRLIIWSIAVLFMLLQFFLQLSTGVIMGTIMKELRLNAFDIGILSSSFYYMYTSLQIPVGFIFDRYNTRTILSLSALLCALGCLFFAASHSFTLLMASRLLIGAGSAFAFIGVTHVLRQYYPLRNFAFLIGLSETLGFVSTMLGMVGMGFAIQLIGWRGFIACAGVFGLLIALGCFLIIPSYHENKARTLPLFPALITIVKNPLLWLNGMFVSLSFTVITVFAALWVIPFVQLKLHVPLSVASSLGSLVFAGAAVSCPVFGKLAIIFHKRRHLLLSSCLSTALLLVVFIFNRSDSLMYHAVLLFLIGLCCGAYMLAYSIANELASKETLSACTGFTNTLAMLSAAILQPLIGLWMDLSNHSGGAYRLIDYQVSLLSIPVCILIAAIIALFLPEKNSED